MIGTKAILLGLALVAVFPPHPRSAELDQMFNQLEPAYTTMAAALACNIKFRVGDGLWRYAVARVTALEAQSKLSAQEIADKREESRIEGNQVAAIGACDSVLGAFQILDLLRAEVGESYPPAEQLKAEPSLSKSPTATATDQPALLIERWMHAYIGCRGGIAENPDTLKACSDRDDFADQLTAVNYCESEDRSKGPNWERCKDPGSTTPNQ